MCSLSSTRCTAMRWALCIHDHARQRASEQHAAQFKMSGACSWWLRLTKAQTTPVISQWRWPWSLDQWTLSNEGLAHILCQNEQYLVAQHGVTVGEAHEPIKLEQTA